MNASLKREIINQYIDFLNAEYTAAQLNLLNYRFEDKKITAEIVNDVIDNLSGEKKEKIQRLKLKMIRQVSHEAKRKEKIRALKEAMNEE